MAKTRLDQLLVARGLCESRAKAQARILAGEVLVADRPVTKAGTLVDEAAPIRLRGDPLPYVGRGGLKLAGALDAFGVNPEGWTCFDAGASTGGVTYCLLQRGAARVYAVDVGTNQLHWKLRSDPRVVSIEHCNLRTWDPGSIPEPCRLLVADLSFISLKLALPPVFASLTGDAEALVLVKPQFEAGRDEVGAGGIVRDAEVHRRVLKDLWTFFQGGGMPPLGWVESPIQGGDGNREFFLHLRMGAPAAPFRGEEGQAASLPPRPAG